MSFPAAVAACMAMMSQIYGVPEPVIHGVATVEGGRPGLVSKNSNGTADYGRMQINTVWLDDIASITGQSVDTVRQRVTDDDCYNIGVGTWILAKEIRRADGDFWRGVGNYHSRTPARHQGYRRKVVDTIRRLFGDQVFQK